MTEGELIRNICVGAFVIAMVIVVARVMTGAA